MIHAKINLSKRFILFGKGPLEEAISQLPTLQINDCQQDLRSPGDCRIFQKWQEKRGEDRNLSRKRFETVPLQELLKIKFFAWGAMRSEEGGYNAPSQI